MDFVRNVGRNDKNIRIVAGIVLIVIALFFAKSFLLTLVGVILLSTGVISFCPAYHFLGKSTATAAETVSASDDLTERATKNLQDFKEEAIETTQELKEKAEDVAQDIKQEAEEFIDGAKEKIEDVIQDGKEKIDDVKKSVK